MVEKVIRCNISIENLYQVFEITSLTSVPCITVCTCTNIGGGTPSPIATASVTYSF